MSPDSSHRGKRRELTYALQRDSARPKGSSGGGGMAGWNESSSRLLDHTGTDTARNKTIFSCLSSRAAVAELSVNAIRQAARAGLSNH